MMRESPARVLFLRARDIADAGHNVAQGAVDAARIIVNLGVVRVDRDVDVERLRRDRPIGHLLVAESCAVGSDAPFEPLLATKGDQVDEAFLDVRFAAGELDMVMADKISQVVQRLLPVVNGHILAVIRPAPIFAIAAFVIAPFNHLAVDGNRHRDVAAGPQINLFRDRVAGVMRTETRQLQNIHDLPRRRDEGFARMVPRRAFITKQLRA